MRRIIIIGIDSASFDIINPLVREGRLPNLSSLIEAGTSGPLTSTIPPVTPPAWVSFMTGKNPGKHGVFDFFGSPSNGYERPLFNSGYIKAKTIWRILTEYGYRLGVVNLPMTHPVEEINGFMIPGMQYSFDSEEKFTQPPDLIDEINECMGNYRVVYGDLESLYTPRLDRYLEEWRDIFEVRRRVILHLMATRQWDIFMPVFYAVDSIQHHFWKFYDSSHPLHDGELARKYRGVIPEFYEKIDSAIGDMLSIAGNETTVMVVSDHGVGPEKESFYLNNWLHRKGFLVFKRSLSPLRIIKFPHLFYKTLRKLSPYLVSWTVPMDHLSTLRRFIDPREALTVSSFIDWRRTKAYAANHTEQGIYINLEGREPGGIVKRGEEYDNIRDNIIKALKEIRDPQTGSLLDMKVFKKEEVYRGPYTVDAPDLLLQIKDGDCLAQKEIYHRELFSPAFKSSGTHRMEGVFILKGSGMKAGYNIEGAAIIDIAPTILYILGKPVPVDMDGRVLQDAFIGGRLEDRSVEYGPATQARTGKDDGVLDDEKTEEVRRSLRDLGYIG
jgi:predicted AlkP superfamily phosphohydrolase/phosphomutase